MIAWLIDQFNDMLERVAAVYTNVVYVNLRGTLSTAPGNYKDFWANELHPTGGDPLFPGKDGFAIVAGKFNDALMKLPPTPPAVAPPPGPAAPAPKP
jgi:hypothetical protein